jgi:hypothetical protein
MVTFFRDWATPVIVCTVRDETDAEAGRETLGDVS